MHNHRMRRLGMGRNVSMSKRADGRNDKNNMGITAGCDIAEDTAKKSEAQAGAQEEARAAKQSSASAQAAAVRWTPEQIFEQIRTTEATHSYLRGRDIRGVADPAIWDASRGDSIADIADRYGVYFEPGDHKRLPGWMQVHYRLAFDAAGLPMLYVFRNCRDTRRTLPLLRYDAPAPEDVDTRQEDHIADEIRYLCQSDPIAPRPVVQRPPKVFDPQSRD